MYPRERRERRHSDDMEIFQTFSRPRVVVLCSLGGTLNDELPPARPHSDLNFVQILHIFDNKGQLQLNISSSFVLYF